MSDVPQTVDFVLAKLRSDCKNRLEFDKNFVIGQIIGYQQASESNLRHHQELLIRRSFLADKERIAALILGGRHSGTYTFSGKFKNLPYLTDRDEEVRQTCIVTVHILHQLSKKHAVRAIDVEVVVLDEQTSTVEPEVDTHVWN